MTGDDQPRSWIGVFHTTLLVSLQLSGRSRASECPVPSGPRNCGQSSLAQAGGRRNAISEQQRLGHTTKKRRIRRAVLRRSLPVFFVFFVSSWLEHLYLCFAV